MDSTTIRSNNNNNNNFGSANFASVNIDFNRRIEPGISIKKVEKII